MKTSSKQYIFILIAILQTFNLSAQSTISGELFLEDQTPALGAFVSLVSVEDSITPLDYTVVDEAGWWEIKTDLQGEAFLRMAYVGYLEYFKKIKISDSLYYKVQLEQDVEVVKEVEVTAEAIDIVQKGDTLRYNIKNFLTGEEQTLGDVLQKLNGFEVDENGQIFYNGKKIDKLLIEGKDILNDQHQLATEGINVEDLLAVDLIDQFKDRRDQFSGTESDKLALNIDLDNKNKAIWSGNIELAGGYQNKFKTSQNLLGVGDKYGLTIFGKGNNTGQTVITSSDFMGLLSPRTLIRELNQSSGNLENLIPASLSIPTNLQKNNDWLLAINGEYTFSNDCKVNASVLSARLDHTSASDFVRNYIGNNQTFAGKYNNESTSPVLNSQFNLEYEWQERLLIQLDLPFNIQKENKNNTWKGIFNEMPSEVVQNENVFSWHVYPELYLNYKINSETHLVGTFSHLYNQNNRNNLLEGIDSLFDFNALSVGQSNETIEQFSTAKVSFYHNYKKIRVGIDAEYTKQEQNLGVLTNLLSPREYTGRNILNTQIITVLPYWRFKNDNWFINTRLNFSQYYFNFDNEKVATRRLNPNLTVRYNFSKLHFLLLRIGTKNQTLSLAQTSDITQIEDGQTLRLGGLSPQNLPFAQTYSLGYTNFNFSNRRLLNVTIATIRQSNIISTQILNEATFVKIQSVIQPFQNNVSGQLLFKQPIYKKWKLDAKMNYQYIESTILNNVKTSQWTYQTMTAQAEIRSNTKKMINYNLGIIFNSQQQIFGETSTSRQLSSIRPKINLTFHKNNWTLKSKFQYFIFINNNAPSPIPNWNLDLMYAPKSKPFTFSIIGNNILGFNPPEQIQLLLNPIFVETQLFDMFSGFLLVQVKYNFKS
ncbi:MAG: hypothetical protein ACPGXZ_10235 [Saprospiraceae bacterium]